MKKLEFRYMIDFVYAVDKQYDSMKENNDDGDNDIAIIAKYDEAAHLITELIRMGYSLHSIELNDVLYNGYDKEYIISLLNLGVEDEIWCEPMLRENGYLNDSSTVIYVMNNCSSKLLTHLDSENIFEVQIGDDADEYTNECDKCVEVTESANNMHGFTVNKSGKNNYNSFSFYSTDKELVTEMAKIFK